MNNDEQHAQRFLTDHDGLSRVQKARLARILAARHSEPRKPQRPVLARPACLIALFLCVWLLFVAGINLAIRNRWVPGHQELWASDFTKSMPPNITIIP